MKSVFISHSWHDKPLAKRIATALQSLGGRVWLDEAEIKLGDSLVQKIREGIDSVDFVIALLSKTSCSSEWVTKEIDIAMNQEIQGKRVKVLPILASKCDLPGFLVGKLYADMSTRKAFTKSLPTLLDRLGAKPELIAKVRSGEKLEKLSGDKWVHTLGEALSSDDVAVQYEGLKSALTWNGESLLAAPEVLEGVFKAIEACKPTHIRARALEVIGSIKDDNFAHRIEPLLTDTNSCIVLQALKVLAAMESGSIGLKVLELLRSTEDENVRRECLRYFGKVELHDESVVLSFVSACEALAARTRDDVGIEILIINALGRQFSSHHNEVLPSLLPRLDPSGYRRTLAVLRVLLEWSGEFYIRSPKLRDALAERIWQSCESEEPEVASTRLVDCDTSGRLPATAR